MEIVIIVILLLIWFSLMGKLGSLSGKIDYLKEELAHLKEAGQPVIPTIQEEIVSSVVEEEEAVDDDKELIDPIEQVPVVPYFITEPDDCTELEPEVEEVTPELKSERTKINYEKYIGENLFGKIGILVLVVGVGLFVKYAIDNEWISETLRTILSFAVGFGLLVIAERLHDKYRTFSSLLAGGGFAIFYVTVAIAYHYYELFSQPVAFAILVTLTLLMSVLAIVYDRRELAIISLIGGFLAPFLISSGEGNYMLLFSYITILNLGMFGLSLYKKWMELPVITFAFTWFILFLFTIDRLIGASSSAEVSIMAGWLLFFATLFYLIFLLPVLSILKNDEKSEMNKVLLSVIASNNFIYLGLGIICLSSMALSFRADGLLTLFVAIVNLAMVLWLRRSNKEYKQLVYMLLGMVLTFVSITVPLQLDGNYITLFWASEMVLLLWLYVQSRFRVYEYFSLILAALTAISFLMDITLSSIDKSESVMFFNSLFATNFFTGLAFLAYAEVLRRYRPFFDTARVVTYTPWNACMLIISMVVLYYSVMNEWYQYLDGALMSNMMFCFTVASILVLSVVFRKRLPFTVNATPYIIGMWISMVLYTLATTVFLSDSTEFSWLTALIVAATLFAVGKQYYEVNEYRSPLSEKFTVSINVLVTLFWLLTVNKFLFDVGSPDESSAGFSVTLAILGTVQMSLGMRLHFKLMRVISLVTFGIILLKLIMIDLWSMPTIGKIFVFIMLGVILLILSFLYQKLKDVLFKDEPIDNE